jgi:hypothetical protein
VFQQLAMDRPLLPAPLEPGGEENANCIRAYRLSITDRENKGFYGKSQLLLKSLTT